ncbi:MAG: hypothetical protein KGN34_08370 [Sphingomonadales bacterium]|nr:hypothetical protein [Sphingomonadales bacterium]
MKARWQIFGLATACGLCCLPLAPALLGTTAALAALKALPLDVIACGAVGLSVVAFALHELRNPASEPCDCTDTCNTADGNCHS